MLSQSKMGKYAIGFFEMNNHHHFLIGFHCFLFAFFFSPSCSSCADSFEIHGFHDDFRAENGMGEHSNGNEWRKAPSKRIETKAKRSTFRDAEANSRRLNEFQAIVIRSQFALRLPNLFEYFFRFVFSGFFYPLRSSFNACVL